MWNALSVLMYALSILLPVPMLFWLANAFDCYDVTASNENGVDRGAVGNFLVDLFIFAATLMTSLLLNWAGSLLRV